MMNHGWGLFVFCSSLLFYLERDAVDRCSGAGNSRCWGMEGRWGPWCARGAGCCTVAHGHALHLVVYVPEKMKVPEFEKQPRSSWKRSVK